MNLVVVGTNHKLSSIEFRERISFSKRSSGRALRLLKEGGVLRGVVILSTCNRVEIYAESEKPEKAVREIKKFISRFHEIDESRLTPKLYDYKGRRALSHIFKVASGLDSAILGETQIRGQIRNALSLSEDADFADGRIRQIFYLALFISKDIHARTGISEGKVSVGSVAVDFIKKKTGGLSGKNVLLVGVGKVTSLVLKYLQNEKTNVIFVANRTLSRAKELASQIGAKAVRFDRFKRLLAETDVVITATSSPHFVIKKETLREAAGRRLLVVDLAVPRDVSPGVKKISGIESYSLEDLYAVIGETIERKKEEAAKANLIIDGKVEEIWKRFTGSEPEKALLL